jgi:hypothetical protein
MTPTTDFYFLSIELNTAVLCTATVGHFVGILPFKSIAQPG